MQYGSAEAAEWLKLKYLLPIKSKMADGTKVDKIEYLA